MAQGSKRSKKGLLNNPIVLIMILLLFAVVGAMQMGYLDTLFGATPEPSTPPRPASSQATAVANSTTPAQAVTPEAKTGTPEGTTAVKPDGTAEIDSGAPQAKASAGTSSAKPGTNSGAGRMTVPAGTQSAQTQPTALPQDQKAAEAKKPVPQKPKVPEFSFAVGRANPFANLAGVTTGTTTSQGPSTSQPTRNTQPANSGASGTKPDGQAAKPKEPWETWQYTGLSTHGNLRIAIIETPTTSYIVKVGDRIEGVWLVEEITREKVVLRGSGRTLVLVLGGDKK